MMLQTLFKCKLDDANFTNRPFCFSFSFEFIHHRYIVPVGIAFNMHSPEAEKNEPKKCCSFD